MMISDILRIAIKQQPRETNLDLFKLGNLREILHD